MPQTTQFQGARLIPNLVYHDADEAIIGSTAPLVLLFCCALRVRAGGLTTLNWCATK